ncbi:DUF4167 domain-containing protein [Devosia sp. XJ19-1]|uniref:DUF4167 domain-containing protein n=1 Tax=Devosia ureilytica TaxID=2952754 RepID=A0A9Q4FUM9_9HYPH|nr:DUF4167 domain-containing protein [Devosia ureilytica]MCP8885341.1 DUF4167 domain-containing protein [Devosia ureilytica]MCP8888983.1 DUF4167 domain-containing protein [Devosia ureilytica]
MRPNQNKNRQRGRNGGRKHVNPLSRNYESNGPDVKVRGNAAHVAEKYLQLARDAQSSGDSVMAENYLQHAEHYFRIVSSAQQALNGPRDGQSQDDVDFDDDANDVNSRFSSPQPVQPVHSGNENERETSQSEAQPQAETAAASEGDGEQAPRKPRERRPRRRRPASEGGADPGNAPQPDVPDLPAFLTGNVAD